MNTIAKISLSLVALGTLATLSPSVEAEADYRLKINDVAYPSEVSNSISLGPKQVNRQLPPQFSDFDKDGNGLISPAEFAKARAERIQENAEQNKRMRMLKNAPSFEQVDLNSDGVVDAEEFARHQLKLH